MLTSVHQLLKQSSKQPSIPRSRNSIGRGQENQIICVEYAMQDLTARSTPMIGKKLVPLGNKSAQPPVKNFREKLSTVCGPLQNTSFKGLRPLSTTKPNENLGMHYQEHEEEKFMTRA